jgi:hypothetical protein
LHRRNGRKAFVLWIISYHAAAANERGAAAFFHFSDCGILVRGQPGSVRTSLWNSSQALRIG